MLLNKLEFMLMNNPMRAAFQRHFEAPRLLEMGGAMNGGRALELGCGPGVGVGLILDVFQAHSVDAFDLDIRMLERARKRLEARKARVRFWIGDAATLPVATEAYDAVFDFGIVHHVPDWRRALQEAYRVLKPGGRIYAEEVLRRAVTHPIVRRLFLHPQPGRFDKADFCRALDNIGFVGVSSREMLGTFVWVTATKKQDQEAT
jgi:ubiquinone/menaquinone biosynthesis C-methylase UbiE